MTVHTAGFLRLAARVTAGLIFMVAFSGCIVVSAHRGASTGGSTRAGGGDVLPPDAAAIEPYAGDSALIVGVVNAFHGALAAGDSATALSLLDYEVAVLESGGVETRAEYRSHHLPADIAFTRAVPSVRGPVHVRVLGHVAWAWSSSTTTGEYRGRAVNSAGAELMVLVRRSEGWRIAAIHWSSRQRRAAQ